MSAFVVDTNVPVVANGRSVQADPECVLACLAALQSIRTDGIIVLDDGLRILGEYMNNLSMSGQPGAGDYFMKWVWDNQYVSSHCRRTTIRERNGADDDFIEFPDDPDLAAFDRSDRKFVAVALASDLKPPILNAMDSDWRDFGIALARHGLNVRNLCPQCLKNEA
jgi:hypothetical protein